MNRLVLLGSTPDQIASHRSALPVGAQLGRVRQVDRTSCIVVTEAWEGSASVAGRLRRGGDAALPVVGDWVALKPPAAESDGWTIREVLPRSTSLARKASGKHARTQWLAANIDDVWIVSALGPDINERRIERFMAIVHEGGARPVLVLTKEDLCDDPAPWVERVRLSAPDSPIFVVSAVTGSGLDDLHPLLGAGRTVVLVGTSGAGKSTLVNALLESYVQRTGANDKLGKGRHTTTGRHLFAVPMGGAIIDSPGVREVALAVEEESLDHAFDDIHRLASECRFSDCRHSGEPGCAVGASVAAGGLSATRVAAWRRLADEQRALQRTGTVASRAPRTSAAPRAAETGHTPTARKPG